MRHSIICALAALSLAGLAACATLDNPSTDLAAAEVGIGTIEAGYAAVCQADTTLSICTPAAQATAQGLEKTLNDAINVASAAIATLNGGATTATITADIQAVVNAVTDLNNFVSDLQAKASAKGLHVAVTVHRR